ncbi:uncharacterized protein LOC127643204 [Xyrauchen texanus]|uniref:uncharacterized protein LOC127643204 n=1 Tax=Xyrauchen texanus TaxID=154827 RepID=UPI002242B962|nr:uncharacterized protein LOC127643204 [Xyrauchen texanus]
MVMDHRNVDLMIFFVLTYFQIPAAPVALIDFSCGKAKKKKSLTVLLMAGQLKTRTPETLQLPPKELGELCQVFQLEELIMSQVQAVERATRSQSASRIWFRQRAGRITASKLKQAIKTNPQQPSKSLIKAICYPEAYRFTTAATSYGCKHEAQARGVYEKLMGREHAGFSCMDSGPPLMGLLLVTVTELASARLSVHTLTKMKPICACVLGKRASASSMMGIMSCWTGLMTTTTKFRDSFTL